MKKLSKNEWIAVVVAIAFIAYMFFGDTIVGAFRDSTNNQNGDMNFDPNGSMVQTQDVALGAGAEVRAGAQVGVNYILTLPDGTIIQDSTQVSGGKPFVFVAGEGQLIKGWEMGIIGMRAGGKRRIIIPPSLGYGDQAVGSIPANSTLVFDIEVVSVDNPGQ